MRDLRKELEKLVDQNSQDGVELVVQDDYLDEIKIIFNFKVLEKETEVYIEGETPKMIKVLKWWEVSAETLKKWISLIKETYYIF